MKKIVSYLFIIVCFSSMAQKSDKLRVGERIPVSKFEVINQNKKVLPIDLPNGKRGKRK